VVEVLPKSDIRVVTMVVQLQRARAYSNLQVDFILINTDVYINAMKCVEIVRGKYCFRSNRTVFEQY